MNPFELADLASAIEVGAKTGHYPAPCDLCGAVMMLRPSRYGRACVMTPGCEGKHKHQEPPQ